MGKIKLRIESLKMNQKLIT